MANVYFGKIDAKDEFKELEAYAGITLSAGTSYLMQFQGCATIQLSSSQPSLVNNQAPGFLLQNNQIFQWTPNGTDKMWIKTWGAATYLNIAT